MDIVYDLDKDLFRILHWIGTFTKLSCSNVKLLVYMSL